MKILLVEDDPSISKALATTLTAHRYTVDTALDGQIALELALQGEHDIIVLDIVLPKLDGLSVCQQLRQQGCQTPILILTAKDANEDIITGLNAGADDYLTKPCDLAHFLARVRALLRRQGNPTVSPILTWGELCLDPILIQVTYLQQVIVLSPKEYSLLELLLRHPQRIFSRSSIINHLWSIDDSPTDAAVTNLIKDLRRKLKSAGMQEELIETVYRLGYRLRTAPKKEVEQVKVEDCQKENLASIGQVVWDFRASLEKRIDILEEAARSPVYSLSSFQHQQVQEEAHRLAGGLGTFGYAKGSDLARAIEYLFIEGDWEEDRQQQFTQLLTELKQEIAKPPTVLLPTLKPLILAIANDTLIAELQQAAPHRGWQVEVVCDRSDVLHRNGNTPSVIFMSINHAVPDCGLMLLQELKIQFPTTPILILTTQDSLDSRVTVARLGVSRYVVQPATTDEIFDAIAQVLPQTTLTDAKVMIVDDDPIALQALATVLQPWGLQITTLNQPKHFWQIFTTTVPDVLLLDLEMPTFNGLELCRVVRQDVYYSDLPILVVTAQIDSVSIQNVFAAGADDFIAKPIIGPELVTRTLAHIERSRIQRQLLQYQKEHLQTRQLQATIDSLTQAANRHYFDEFLHREWQRLADAQAPLSLISYDIDYFKSYNDLYGYPAGDNCLQQVTRVVWDCIKPGRDLVARLGGDEFVIVLPETSLEQALQVAQRIQQAIAQLQIPHPSGTHQYITLSLGISGTIPQLNISPQELIAIATQALYAAKARSRNTYCLYPL
ncbi:response regulator [Gloeocapsopsis dulcis]|uniref:Multi-component transcriptional regulator n=1 Tax=Gloeocapsopsis dulcis AAB1 = 1H9 TaxID=1433147 RepID=A0A6N8G256_9CHRO|nr:response regulator [Gloeocapsopsis dulcis]MUL38972.1 multi-component transcriptional regulator [Gloeocapsopsis dulcis AAB1 = 1H9]WNN90244.1 response regulator [Gloeocapsopsis dulcis]